MTHYIFLVTAVGDGYGGLEHRASTALLCARDDLPYAGMQGMPERLPHLSRSVQPRVLPHLERQAHQTGRVHPYNLDAENYTTLLWAFEGFTSYYDDLALLRCGVIGIRTGSNSSRRRSTRSSVTPAGMRQTLAESSFDAWTKYYRPDENTPNAVVSYYAKGALLALALDLTLRAEHRRPRRTRRRHARALATTAPTAASKTTISG
jgi:predicted metalloprotease with PDZ domain